MDAGRSADFTYDALHRLKTAATSGSLTFPQWGLSWTYDRYGNRTAQTQTAGAPPTNSVTVDATTNRLSGYTYDASGNLTVEPMTPLPPNNYTYDGENRLTNFSSGSGSGTYTYDGNGLRVRKCLPNCTSPTSTTVYIFSGTKVVAEYENGAAPGSPTREYVYSGSQLLATLEGGGTKYHHTDHLSVRLHTDAAGNVSRTFAHYPYGEVWYETGTASKWKFTTYERDAESGNDYAIFRTYVNRLGRFSSPDPLAGSILDPQSLNRYAYTRNNPINRIDPLGLADEEPCGGQECIFQDVFNSGYGWDWDWMQAAYEAWRGVTLTEILFGRFGDPDFSGRSPRGPGGDCMGGLSGSRWPASVAMASGDSGGGERFPPPGCIVCRGACEARRVLARLIHEACAPIAKKQVLARLGRQFRLARENDSV